MACKAVAGFLDTIVSTVFTGLMEMSKWVVYGVGKLVAVVLQNT